MSKKSLVIILILSVVVMWLVKEIHGALKFSLGGLDAGLPLSFYKCSFISSCSIEYGLLVINIVFWFAVLFIIWKFVLKRS